MRVESGLESQDFEVLLVLRTALFTSAREIEVVDAAVDDFHAGTACVQETTR